MGRRNIPMTTQQDILDMAEAGMNINNIADEVGVSRNYVYTLLRDKGVGLVQEKLIDQLSAEEIDQFIEEYNSDVPLVEIRRRHGWAPNQLYALVAQTGLTPRKYKPERIEAKKQQMDHAIQMYIGGAPVWKIVEETGVHQPQLHQELHRRKIPLRRMKAQPSNYSVKMDRTGRE